MENKEAMEFMKSTGFILGNLHEAFKDGIGVEDFKVAVDLGKEYEMIGEGFKGLGDINFKEMKQENLVMLFMGLMTAFEQGKK